MKDALLLLTALCAIQVAAAQPVFVTRNGQLSFASRSTLEDIYAVNNEVSSVFDMKSGELLFAVLVKGFHFKRSLMEEHFNENYMESDKYPRSTFKGRIVNLGDIPFAKDGVYPATVEGDLTIHNVTRKVMAKGTISVQGGDIATQSKFSVKLKDYNIRVPAIVADKISEDIDITVNCRYLPKKGQ